MIEWISIKDRVPATRKNYLIWGDTYVLGLNVKRGICLGVSKYNPGDAFDICKTTFSLAPQYVITHWAEIVGPNE